VEPIKELANELFRERVRRAREMSPEEKFIEGHGCSTWPARS